MSSLDKSDFVRILTEPKNALIRQYVALLETENTVCSSRRTPSGDRPHQRRGQREDGEHRRPPAAHDLEKLLDEVSFTAPEMPGREVRIDAAYVSERLDAILKNEDLSRYIL